MAVWRLQVNTGGANVADYCLQNHVAALGGWQGTCYGAFTFYISVCDELELVPDGKVVFYMFFGETGWVC